MSPSCRGSAHPSSAHPCTACARGCLSTRRELRRGVPGSLRQAGGMLARSDLAWAQTAAALARHRLDETATQLDAALRLLDRAAHATDWQSRAADSHHCDIADLRGDVARLRGRVDELADTAAGVGVLLDRLAERQP